MRLCAAKARRFLCDRNRIRPFKINTRRFQSFLPSPATRRPTPCLNSGTILEILMTSLTMGPDYTHTHKCTYAHVHQALIKYPVHVNVPIVSINVYVTALEKTFTRRPDQSQSSDLDLVLQYNSRPWPKYYLLTYVKVPSFQ